MKKSQIPKHVLVIGIWLLFGAWCLGFGISRCAFAGLEQAEASFLKGDYGLAIKYCDEIINSSANVDMPAAYYLKARTLLKQNKIEEAQEIFVKILTLFPESQFCSVAQFGLGDIYFAQEDFNKAIGEYRKVQEKYPQSRVAALTLYKLGKSYLKIGSMEQARFYFQKLQSDYPLSFESKLIDELDNSEFVYSVQVGCFSKYENAEKLADSLKKKGFDAYISEKEGYPVFYRVRVGKFKTRDEARSCKASLEKKGFKTKICP